MNAISSLYQKGTIISDAQTVAEEFQKQDILSRIGSDTKKQKKVIPAGFAVSCLFHLIIQLHSAINPAKNSMKQIGRKNHLQENQITEKLQKMT